MPFYEAGQARKHNKFIEHTSTYKARQAREHVNHAITQSTQAPRLQTFNRLQTPFFLMSHKIHALF